MRFNWPSPLSALFYCIFLFNTPLACLSAQPQAGSVLSQNQRLPDPQCVLQISSLHTQGRLYAENGALIRAEAAFQRALALSDSLHLGLLQLESHHTLAHFYQANSQYKTANRHWQAIVVLQDSLFTQALVTQAAEIRSQFEMIKQEEKSTAMRQQQQTQRIQRQHWIIISTILILCILLTLLWTVRQSNQKLARKQKELEQVNANKDRFFSIVAHDLRHPFQTLTSYIRLMENHAAEFTPTEIGELTRDLKEGVSITADLLENLLEWSQCQTGTLHIQRSKYYLGPIVDRAMQQACGPANTKGVLLASTIENPIKIHADRQMLETMLRNLITNAVKYTCSGGEIVVSAIETDQWVEIEVRDTGVGIDRQTLNNLFRIDKRVSTRGTDDERGTGLGLILCKEFIDLHAGEIHVNSVPGEGSCFTIKLPTVLDQ